MKKKIYKIEPVFEERIWGSQEIRNRFNYDTDLGNIAEVYNVVAQPGHLDNYIKELNIHLSDFYDQNRELFGCEKEVMPVMICMAHSIDYLSIQVHPDDAYGLEHDGQLGRPEGWIIYDGPENNDVILGNNAKNKEEFIKLSNDKEWNKLFRHVNQRKLKDYIHVPAGRLHAFCKDALAIAFSTNGDLTYRLYDFDRIDSKTGKTRDLHIQKVFDTIMVPDKAEPYVVEPIMKNGYTHTLYYDVAGEYTCGRIEVEEQARISEQKFMFYTCASGEGTINDVPIKAGETLFVPCDYGEITLGGKLDLVYITYKDEN